MANITASDVKTLRERTGAGMMECKKALVEAEGNLEVAEDIIAKSGHKKAAKKAGRAAAEGLVLTQISDDNRSAVMIEVNSETDFVARDDSFNKFCNDLLALVAEHRLADVDKINALPMGNYPSVDEARQALIAKIGENINFRRAACIEKAEGVAGAYSHGNRIGVLVELAGGTPELAKDIAMQVAAMQPQYVSPEQVPADIIEREKEICMARAQESGKPANIIEKMVEGAIQKFLGEICLVGQPFVKDQNKKVGQLLKESNASVKSVTRFAVGEGIEIEKKSFHEEVMEQAKGK